MTHRPSLMLAIPFTALTFTTSLEAQHAQKKAGLTFAPAYDLPETARMPPGSVHPRPAGNGNTYPFLEQQAAPPFRPTLTHARRR